MKPCREALSKAAPAALPPPLAEARPVAPRASSPPPTPMMDERTLCDHALRGDIAAWNALVQKHNHRVVVSLLARGVHVDRAKDIAQEAWMRLIEQQKLGKLSHLSLPGLAVTQASYLALEAARRAKRNEAVALSPDDFADPSANAEAQLLTAERVAHAQEILARCSPSAKAVFKLAYSGEGLSHAEIAERVGLSLQRVRQIICEVRKELRGAFEGAGHE
jgi:RNA polymerase sigma-70 factor (ECF subfamily)